MKKQLSALCGLGLLLLAISASAQTVNMKLDVPFDFVVAGATLPAGEYTIQELSGKVMSIRSLDQNAHTLALSNACGNAKITEESKAVFHRYGNRYFLAQVWMADTATGRELPKSAAEREITAANSFPQETVLLVASR